MSDTPNATSEVEEEVKFNPERPFDVWNPNDPEIFQKQKNYVMQSISNGSINPRILTEFFKDMKLKSYDYDYRMQLELVGLYHVTLSMDKARNYMLKGAYSKTYDRVYEFTIRHRIINPKDRERFKRSEFFNKYVDYETINANGKFYTYTLLVTSGPKIITNYRVKAVNSSINLCFLKKDFDPTIKEITVYFLPESINSIFFDPTADDFSATTTDASHFQAAPYFYKIKNYIAFWINKETNIGYMVPGVSYDDDAKKFTVGTMLPTDVTKFHLMVVGIRNMHEIGDYNFTTKWLQFHEHKMPLPKDNMIIMICKDHVYQMNDGSVSITEYYPNIYSIDNPNKYNLRIIELYEENSENEHIVYDNEVRRYLEGMETYETYTPAYLPKTLMEYKPVKWTYNEEQYLKDNPYNELDLKNRWTPLLYKVYTISHMMKKWYKFYDEYQRRTYGFLSGWYHKISNYKNMNEKLRMDSSIDVDGNEDFIYHFKEPQYVFSYVHNAMLGDANSFCFFIDGKYTIPTRIIIYRGYQHVYFPASKITLDSVIEVERFDSNYFSYRVKLPKEGTTLELKRIMHYDTVANNFFLVSSTGEFLKNGEVETYIIDPELGEIQVDLNTSLFIVSTKSKIRFVPTDKFEGDEVLFCSNDITFQYKAKEIGDDFITKDPSEVTLNPKDAICKAEQDFGHRLRIYTEDGRLITKRSYQIYKYDNYFKPPKFNIPIQPGTERTFMVSYIGYDERLVYHTDKIPTNGLVELDGKLSRPVNLAYHDIYLNGFRLTKYDIDMIAPFCFVLTTLGKFGTVSTLEIYEKCSIPDYYEKYDWADKSDFIMDKLFEEDKVSPEADFYEALLRELRTVSIDPTIEDVDDICDWYYNFFRDYVMYHYLNGDTRVDLEPYHHVFNENGRLLLNADDRVKYKESVKKHYWFDHDKTLAEYGTDPSKYPQAPEQERFDETVINYDPRITMDEADYRQHGYKYTYDSSDPTQNTYDATMKATVTKGIYDTRTYTYTHVYDTGMEFKEDVKTTSENPKNTVALRDPKTTIDRNTTYGMKDPEDEDLKRYQMPAEYA